MISCEEALERIQEYLDGELEGVDSTEVHAHFEVCQRCYPHLRFETSFREVVKRATSSDQAPEELRAKVMAVLEEARSEG